MCSRRASWGAVWVICALGDEMPPLLGLGWVVPPSQMVSPREAHARPFDGGGHLSLRKVGLLNLAPFPRPPRRSYGHYSPAVFHRIGPRDRHLSDALGVLYLEDGLGFFSGEFGGPSPGNRRGVILSNLRISYRSLQQRMAESGPITKQGTVDSESGAPQNHQPPANPQDFIL